MIPFLRSCRAALSKGLRADDFLDESRHSHTLRDEVCSSVAHGRLAAGAVNSCDLNAHPDA
jgi:hypothetical protein